MSHTNLLGQIQLAIGELPASEEKIASFILQDPKNILSMTIHELAREAGASSAAVVRLCKSLGVDGFSRLKIQLSAELTNQIPQGFLEVEADEGISQIIEKASSNTIQTILDTANQLEAGAIEKIVGLLREAETIFVYGIGASFLIAEDIAAKWSRLGKRVFATADRHILTMAMATQSAKAVFWGISYSGDTKEVIQLVKQANGLGMTTIGLTRMGSNKLSQTASVVLTTARAPEAALRTAATTSRFAQLFVIDALFLSYASSQFDETVELLERSKQAVIDLN